MRPWPRCRRRAFQLTHLLRGATPGIWPVRMGRKISTHAPLARCDRGTITQAGATPILTHAPLARCDQSSPGLGTGFPISTHAPLARCDIRNLPMVSGAREFQLTHLLRGATQIDGDYGPKTHISTHAPLARCDISTRRKGRRTRFQLTHLLRGATGPIPAASFGAGYFNSRTSCEVRRAAGKGASGGQKFQLTHLLRGATDAGCDWLPPGHFNSRTSCEVRPG